MPWRRLSDMSPDLFRYLNYAAVILSMAGEILRAYLRSQAKGSNDG